MTVKKRKMVRTKKTTMKQLKTMMPSPTPVRAPVVRKKTQTMKKFRHKVASPSEVRSAPLKEDVSLQEELKALEGSRILNDDFDMGREKDSDDNNPFKELRHLITSKNIDVKTLLTEKQIIVNHKLNTLQNQLDMEDSSEAKKCAKMLDFFSNRYMTLVINKEGKSRQQFIEALHRGGDRAEEARRLKLEDGYLRLS